MTFVQLFSEFIVDECSDIEEMRLLIKEDNRTHIDESIYHTN